MRKRRGLNVGGIVDKAIMPGCLVTGKGGNMASKRETDAEAKRRGNAEKQKRYRKNMKSEGFRQVLLWAVPCAPGVRERMTAAGFRQVPAWENETPGPGQTRREKRRGDPEKVRVTVSVREGSLAVADRREEVRAALGVAVGAFIKALGEVPESESLCNDVRELLRPLGGI